MAKKAAPVKKPAAKKAAAKAAPRVVAKALPKAAPKVVVKNPVVTERKIVADAVVPTPVVMPARGLGQDAKAMMRFESNRKSVGAAFLLWIFFGMIGGHRFYLARPWTAVIMLLLTISMFGALITALWALIDAFLIPGMVRDYNNGLADTISRQHDRI